MGRSCRIDSLEQGFPNSQSILAVGAFRLDLRKFGINSPRLTNSVAMVAARPTSPVATIATRYILSSMIVCVKRESLTDQKAAASHFSRPLMSFDPAALMTLICLRCG